MKYCTFKYRIVYEDGEITNGWSPFHGEEINNFTLTRFVNHCFLKTKPAKVIVISDVFKISDAALWLAHVQHTVEFKYLRASNGFAAQLMNGSRNNRQEPSSE